MLTLIRRDMAISDKFEFVKSFFKVTNNTDFYTAFEAWVVGNIIGPANENNHVYHSLDFASAYVPHLAISSVVFISLHLIKVNLLYKKEVASRI